MNKICAPADLIQFLRQFALSRRRVGQDSVYVLHDHLYPALHRFDKQIDRSVFQRVRAGNHDRFERFARRTYQLPVLNLARRKIDPIENIVIDLIRDERLHYVAEI